MNTRQPAPSSETSLGKDLLYALRYYLGGRRAWLALAALAGLGGLVLNWSWLVAVGVAPLLVTFLPCAAMCALGLCMNRMKGGSCSSEEAARNNARPEADTSLRGGPAIPPLVLVDEPDSLLVEAEDSEGGRHGSRRNGRHDEHDAADESFDGTCNEMMEPHAQHEDEGPV